MKITWFGGRTLRVHIGGQIIVLDPRGRSAETGHAEVVSGADQLVEWGGPYREVDPRTWRPRRSSLRDEDDRQPVEVLLIGFEARLIDAVGEPPLVLMGTIEGAGNWSRDAVVVAYSEDAALAALNVLGPRLVALALPEGKVEPVFSKLSNLLDGTTLVALEPGLALEV
ncbi:MAG: hypothetical protein ABL866_13630 [Devosia sp.]